MISKKGLVNLGFSHPQADALLKNTEFIIRVKRKSDKEFAEVFKNIRTVYGATKAQVIKAVMSFPLFVGLNHSRVVVGIQKVYGVTKAQAIKTVLSNPQFAGYNHSRVVVGIQKVYGATKAQATKAVMSFPQFAGLNHLRVVADIQDAYGATKAQATKAVMSFPQFAGLNHLRVVRQAMRMGHIIGLNRQEITEAILNKPALAGYSQRRNLAAIDAFRNAVRKTGSTKTNKELFEIYLKDFITSPYSVKGSKKRETWWRRKGNQTQSKMGRVLEKKLRKAKRPR